MIKVNQKLTLPLGKRAYLQIDFLFAIAAFLLFFYTVVTIYEDNENTLQNTLENEVLRIQAKDICYQLTSFEGLPNNWETDVNNVQAIGLKDSSRNYLNSSKITSFQNTSNYFVLLDSLNVDSFVFVNISSISSSTISHTFGNKVEQDVNKATYTCYKSLNSLGSPVQIYVEVWQ